MRKKICITIVLVFFLFASSIAGAAQLTDIQGHWAEQQIEKWISAGLTGGYGDGTFRPDNPITRAEFSAYVNRAFKPSAIKSMESFSDVSETAWYYDDVKVAFTAGIMGGYPDNSFQPDNPITRQEAASVLARLLDLAADDDGISFADDESIADWAKSSVKAVSSFGLMGGYPDGTFRGQNPITRAETVVILEGGLNLKVAATVFDEAGEYGPETGMQTIKGNVTINAPDIILRNTLIAGDLLLGEGIGDGDVTLKNVRVIGKTTVKGGGENSITFEDCTLPNITVSKDGVRIVAAGNTTVTTTTLESGATLVSVTTVGEGFQTVTISQIIPAGAAINLSGEFEKVEVAAANAAINVTDGSVKELVVSETAPPEAKITLSGQFTQVTVAAPKSEVVIAEGSVNTLTVQTEAKISGEGTINTANIKASGVEIAQTPTNVNVDQGVTATVGGQTVTPTTPPITGGGGGGGGGTSSLSVSNINMVADGSPQGTNLSGLDGDKRVSGISFTTNTASSTLELTGVESPKTGEVAVSRTFTFDSTSASVSIEGLLGFPQSDIRLDTLRSIFGNSVTIKGILSASGYTSYTDPITITLGTDPSGASGINEWVTLTQPSATVFRATIKSGMGGTLLKNIGIATFLNSTFNELPSAVKIGANNWESVEATNYNTIKTQLGALGSGWDSVTIADLVGENILLKRPGSDTEYTLEVVDQ